MKPLFSLFLLLGLAITASAQKVVNDPNAEVRSVGSFHGLNISNAFEVIISQGSQEALAVSANHKEDMEFIRTEVEGGTLKIWFDSKKKNWRKGRKLKAYVSVRNLDALKVSGACEVQIDGTLKVTSLDINLSGASDVHGRLEVSELLDAKLSGASDLNISGSANTMQIDASGASDVKAYDFQTNICKVEASGACSVSIHVEKELSARLSGASSISYRGSGAVREVKTSGASSINRKS